MNDRTRSAIEEDFSLEEQNFQSVIDMETEDDYSRGNTILFTYARTIPFGGGADVILTSNNYFLEAFQTTIAYASVTVGTPSSPTSCTANFQVFGSPSGAIYQQYFFSVGTFTPPPLSTTFFPLNIPIFSELQVLAARGDSITVSVTFNVTGSSISSASFVFALNAYGRIVP